MAGFADRLSHAAFMWLTQAHTSRRTPDEIRLSVLLTAYGLLTSGTTGAIDHFPGRSFTAADMDAVLSAWQESGMRVALGMRFFDGAFSDIFPKQPVPEDLRQRMAAVEILKPQGGSALRDLMEDTIRRCTARGAGGAAGSFQSILHRQSRPLHRRRARHMRGAGGAIRHRQPHPSARDRAAGAACRRALRPHRGQAPRQPRRALRALVLAHCNWLTDDDIDLMAGRGAVAVLNPESNAVLGTGRARAPDMRRRG